MKRHGYRLIYCLFAASVSMLPACGSDGHFTLLGYSTAPNYDCTIRTVHVPICKNKTMSRGLEFDVTRAIIREIQAKTPYRVLDTSLGADTELLCTIVARPKSVVNQNQLGEVRESQVSLSVEVIWRDLRPGHTGDVLSQPGQGRVAGQPPAAPGTPLRPGIDDKIKPLPVVLTPTTTYQPELGGSMASAQAVLADKLALQIVSMMEIWGH